MKNNNNLPKLADQFPIAFENGHKIDILVFWCTSCGNTAKLDEMFGYVSKVVCNVADVRASFKCGRCNKISTYRIRLKDDRSYSYLHEEKGTWQGDRDNRPLIIRIKLKVIGLVNLWLILFKLRRIKFKLRAIQFKINRLLNR